MSVNVQDHIHLYTTLLSSPEYSPTYKWTINKRDEPIVFKADIADTLSGNIYAHVIQSSGSPVVRHNYNYEIKLIGDVTHDVWYYKNLLDSMAGKYVYLTDIYHPDDGEDHSNYTFPYFVIEIGPYPTDHYALAFFYVPIVLVSMVQPT